MKNKFKATALIATVLIFTATVVNGQNRQPQKRMSYQGQCLEIPGLTEDQKAKITSINDAHREKVDGMRESVIAEEDLFKANEIKANMILEQNNHLKEISKVLDGDQLEYFKENVLTKNNQRGRSFARGGRGGQNFGQANRSGRGGQKFGHGNMQGRGSRAFARAPRGRRGSGGRW